MKKYLKLYFILNIFLLFCTGCNNNKQLINIGDKDTQAKYEVTRYKNGTVLIEEDTSGKEGENGSRFELGDIKFGPEKIRFGNE